MNRFKLL